MKQIRVRVILLAGWLLLFCSAEQLLEPYHISAIAYLFILGLVITQLFTPRFVSLPLWVVITIPLFIFLILKVWTRTLTSGAGVLLTITEGSCIAITALLGYWVSVGIKELENAIAHITIGYSERQPEPASLGQGSIYREVQRARNHHRPLALMAVSVEERSIKLALDRMVQQAQIAMMKQYALSGVSKTLCNNLENCDIIMQKNDHLLIALPETKPQDLPGLVMRVRQQISDQVGVELKIGTASLIQDGFTMEGLIDKATMDMEADFQEQPFMELSQLPVDPQGK